MIDENDEQFDQLKSWLGARSGHREDARMRLARSFGERGGWLIVYLISALTLVTVLAFCSRAHAETVRLSWTPPTRNTDDSALTNLAGYRIYYGTSSTALTTMLPVNNPSITTQMIAALPPATYYFAVRAYNAAGAESVNSNIASKVVAADPVNCAVSAYSAWSAPAWSACVNGTQTRQETRTRTILTQPSNGGTVCPALTETRTASQSCAAPILLTTGGDVWIATPNYSGPWPEKGWRLGAKAGTIPPKIKCDATRRIDADYFRVTGSITWTGSKKNYVVARCALQ